MGKIFALDSITIDKIAAGEVVESPAGCVKELIENALDAGATEIIIEIELGGRQKIEIRDNGSGISREDLPLAVQRFATSKITVIDDLEKLSTLGFRGEALSAISSVSQVQIVTSDGSSGLGAFELCVDGGVLSQVTSALREKGTTISATALFFNVPARRKFLKPPSKEAYEITRIVQAIALANPECSFRLMHDGVLEIDAPSELLRDRIIRFFGNLEKQDLIPITWSGEDLAISGYICSPKHLKANRTGQFLSINHRPVHSLSLSYAVRDGYGPACDTNKYPLFFLQLQMDPKTVDVNIHPQKREVRLYQEEWVRRQLSDQVAKAVLGGVEPVFALTEGKYSEPLPSMKYSVPFEFPRFEEPKIEPKSVQLQFETARYSIASVQKEYAFLIIEEKMAVIALKELYQKIAFLNFSKRAQTSSDHGTQLLLDPVLVRLTSSESKQLEALLPQLNRCGFLIRPFGNSSFYIDALPKELESLEIEKFIQEVIEDSSGLLRMEKLASVATKHIKFGTNLRPLLDVLFATDGPYLSLSGKPFLHTFTQVELDNLFY